MIPFFRNNSKELVSEVWRITDQDYFDPTFNKVDWQAVRENYVNRHYTNTEAAYTAIREMLKKLNNPSTRFLDPAEFQNYKVEMTGELIGVGIQMKVDDEDNKLRVIRILEDSPAFSAGISVNDILTHIDGKPTKEMTVDRASTLIRGQVNTQVLITIQRDDKRLDYKLNRARIHFHPVQSSQKKSSIGKIGYIRLEQFSDKANQEMQAAIEKLEKQNVKGYILDLRFNPGGLTYVTTDIARMWLEKGIIFSTVYREGKQDQEQASSRALTNKPLVVLINKDSASAAEILAGALQDNKRAVLVGTKTFEQGLVENVRELSDKQLGLAVSVAKVLRPNGQPINKRGIHPDIEIKLTKNQEKFMLSNRKIIATTKDLQFMRAVEVLSRQIELARASGTELATGESCQLSDSLCIPKIKAEDMARICLEKFLLQEVDSWFTWHFYNNVWQFEQWNSDTGIKIENLKLTRADELNGVKWKGSGELRITAVRVKDAQGWSKWTEPESFWSTPEYRQKVIGINFEYVESR